MVLFIENEQNKIQFKEENESLIKKAIILSLQKEKFDIPSEVSVILLDNEGIRKVNKEHRNIDLPTDVLSFPLVEMHEGNILSDIGRENFTWRYFGVFGNGKKTGFRISSFF